MRRTMMDGLDLVSFRVRDFDGKLLQNRREVVRIRSKVAVPSTISHLLDSHDNFDSI